MLYIKFYKNLKFLYCLQFQLFTYEDVDVTMAIDFSTTNGSQKRQKVEISLNSYLCNIQETRNWLW